MTRLADFWGPSVRSRRSASIAELPLPHRGGHRRRRDPGKTRARRVELATRLSFLFLQRLPTTPSTPPAPVPCRRPRTNVRSARLIARAGARSVVRILSEMLRLGELDALPQLPTVPTSDSATLERRFVPRRRGASRARVRRERDTASFSRPANASERRLADLYDVSGPTGMELVPSTFRRRPRAGYSQASFLALNAIRTRRPPRIEESSFRIALCSSIPRRRMTWCRAAREDQNRRAATVGDSPARAALRRLSHRDGPHGLALEHSTASAPSRDGPRYGARRTGVLDDVAFDGARELGQALADGLLTPEGPRERPTAWYSRFQSGDGHSRGGRSIVVPSSAPRSLRAFPLQGAPRRAREERRVPLRRRAGMTYESFALNRRTALRGILGGLSVAIALAARGHVQRQRAPSRSVPKIRRLGCGLGKRGEARSLGSVCDRHRLDERSSSHSRARDQELREHRLRNWT